jgi:hypothetical protein
MHAHKIVHDLDKKHPACYEDDFAKSNKNKNKTQALVSSSKLDATEVKGGT